MHDDHMTSRPGSCLKSALAAESSNIIDYASARSGRPIHHLGMSGVNRKHGSTLPQTTQRWQHARQFLIAGDRRSPRAG